MAKVPIPGRHVICCYHHIQDNSQNYSPSFSLDIRDYFPDSKDGYNVKLIILLLGQEKKMHISCTTLNNLLHLNSI